LNGRAQKANKKARKGKAMNWHDVVEEKERNVMPLNHNVGFWRLTQLFGRSLYIKYFIKNINPQQLLNRSHSKRLDSMRM